MDIKATLDSQEKLACPLRLVFAILAGLIWIGIALSGFGAVSWFLYLPAIITTIVAATGICMGTKVTSRLCDS